MSEPTYYKHVGDADVDANVWPDASLQDADGNELYTFTGDSDGSANGASAEWVVSSPAPATDPTPVVDGAPANVNEPTAPVAADSSDEVAEDGSVLVGPEVVSAKDVEASDDDVSDVFDGTMSTEDRADYEADIVAAQTDAAEDSVAVAKAQGAADLAFHDEHPDLPIVRAANPAVGGERFYA